jgi:hypothetical protein
MALDRCTSGAKKLRAVGELPYSITPWVSMPELHVTLTLF